MAKPLYFFAFVAGLCCLANSTTCAQNPLAGEAIFKHVWEPGDIHSPNGDGLGPAFNAQSCAQCHHQSGLGGGGDLKFNLDLIYSDARTKQEKKHLAQIHPGFRAPNGDFRSMLVLHRFSLAQEYTSARSNLIPFDGAIAESDEDLAELEWGIARHPLQPVRFDGETQGLRIQRNTPALFGIGLIDRVKLRQLTDVKIKTQSPNVTGRPSLLGAKSVDIGRFGWRAQVNTLEAFVAMACASELGLENRFQSQIVDPTSPDYRPPGSDISDANLQHLTAFVRALPRPELVMPADPKLAKRVSHGKEVFHSVGCTDCHVENRAGIREIYSDLLLHDMGPRLADPILPPPKRSQLTISRRMSQTRRTLSSRPRDPLRRERPRRSGTDVRLVDVDNDGSFDVTNTFEVETGPGSPPIAEGAPQVQMLGYYGGFTPLPPQTNESFGDISFGDLMARVKRLERQEKQAKLDIPELAREWRTPPLWGVASSAPYLHDGRAATLMEAVLLHGGEAQDSIDKFLALNHQDQAQLIEFMRALKAPLNAVQEKPKAVESPLDGKISQK